MLVQRHDHDLNGIPECPAGAKRQPRPQGTARPGGQKEAELVHAHGTSDRRRHSRKPRNELGDYEGR